MGSSNVLMVIAVVAVAVATFGFVFNILGVGQSTGFASNDGGNVTFEIESSVHINFTNNIINWSTGYVNTSGPAPCLPNVEAQLATYTVGEASDPSGIFCGVNWQPQLQGLTLQSDSNQDIRVNLSSNQNATTLIDGAGNNFGSNFRWRVSNNESGACNDGAYQPQPATYSEIVINTNVTICDSLNWGPTNDSLDIDFLLNISDQASLLGYQTAVITALAERGVQNTTTQ